MLNRTEPNCSAEKFGRTEPNSLAKVRPNRTFGSPLLFHIFPCFVQGWDHPGGSQTLPNRKGNKKVAVKPQSADDSEVVIKKQGLNGVKIQLNLNEQEQEQSLEYDYEVDQLKKISDSKVQKRKYTLEELEVEGFESTSSSKNSDFEEEVDLNSLIEGDVDEIDEEIGKQIICYDCQLILVYYRGR